MLRLLIAALLVGATPAAAAQWVHCADPSGAASFDYLAGDDSGTPTVDALTISAGERVWASDPANGPGDPVSVGQALFDAETVRIDAVDGNLQAIAALRLFTSTQEGETVFAGTLNVPGQGVWAVVCETQ